MKRIAESNHLMLNKAQCKAYNDSFETHGHELSDYVNQYKEIVGVDSGTIIDLGSGSCNFVIALCLEFPNLKVICYEESDEMIVLAKENIENNNLKYRITLIKDNMFNAKGKYDAVLANRVLHHIDDTESFWKLISELSDKFMVNDIERFEDVNDLISLENFARPLLDPIFFEDTFYSFRAAYSSIEVLNQVKDYNFTVKSYRAGLPQAWYKKLLIHHNK